MATKVIRYNPLTGEALVDVVENVFCPTGDGGGRDPSCGRGEGGSARSSISKLSRTDFSKLSPAELKKAATPVGKIKTDAMGKAESMLAVEVDGVEVLFNSKTAKSAQETLASSSEVHKGLWKQNKQIVFASQKDPTTAALGRQLGGDVDILARAGTGDGSITVWAGKSITPAVLAHESAHNLAVNKWKSMNPDTLDKKNNFAADRKVTLQGMRQRIPNGVTELGKSSPAEDFAEFVAAYNEIHVRGKKEYNGATEKTLSKRPKGLAVVKKLLEG